MPKHVVCLMLMISLDVSRALSDKPMAAKTWDARIYLFYLKFVSGLCLKIFLVTKDLARFANQTFVRIETQRPYSFEPDSSNLQPGDSASFPPADLQSEQSRECLREHARAGTKEDDITRRHDGRKTCNVVVP